MVNKWQLFYTVKRKCTVGTWIKLTSLHTLHTPPSRWTLVLCECCHWYVSIWQLFQMRMIYFQPPHICLVPLCQGIFCDYFLWWRSEVLELCGAQFHLRFLLLQQTDLLQKCFLIRTHHSSLLRKLQFTIPSSTKEREGSILKCGHQYQTFKSPIHDTKG